MGTKTLLFLALATISIFCACSAPPLKQSHQQKIVLLGTNDFHGAFTPLPYVASFIRSLRAKFGEDLIWLDAGDEFQGTLESNSDQGASLVKYFNALGLSAAAIGNHELDFGEHALESRILEAHYPYLAANWGTRIPRVFPSKVLTAGKLKIGIIGLGALDSHLSVLSNSTQATIEESKKLRSNGAQVILLVAHFGLNCDDGPGCKDDGDMLTLLSSLPPQTVDAVVAGHTHRLVHHKIAGVPVIESPAYGKYLNLIYLTYDFDLGRVDPNLTRIEGPVSDLERKFVADSEATEILRPAFEKVQALKRKQVGTAARPIEHFRWKESPLGNLITDAMRAATHADFSLINPGAIRSPWPSGSITFGDVYQSLPFETSLVKIHLSGKELRRLLQVIESDSSGFSPFSGLKLRSASSGRPQDIQIIQADDSPLIDKKIYTLATTDFLLTLHPFPKKRLQSGPWGSLRDEVIKFLPQNGALNSKGHPLVNPEKPRIELLKHQ